MRSAVLSYLSAAVKGSYTILFYSFFRPSALPLSPLLLLSYLCKLPRWNFLKKQNWKAGSSVGDEGGSSPASPAAAAAAVGEASASPVQLLSPAMAPRQRLFQQFQDGEEQGGFLLTFTK